MNLSVFYDHVLQASEQSGMSIRNVLRFVKQCGIDAVEIRLCHTEYGAIDVQPYEYYDRDLIINADFETALDIASGETELAEAFAEEKIDVWGDFDKAIEIFSIILGMNKKAKPKKTTKKG